MLHVNTAIEGRIGWWLYLGSIALLVVVFALNFALCLVEGMCFWFKGFVKIWCRYSSMSSALRWGVGGLLAFDPGPQCLAPLFRLALPCIAFTCLDLHSIALEKWPQQPKDRVAVLDSPPAHHHHIHPNCNCSGRREINVLVKATQLHVCISLWIAQMHSTYWLTRPPICLVLSVKILKWHMAGSKSSFRSLQAWNQRQARNSDKWEKSSSKHQSRASSIIREIWPEGRGFHRSCHPHKVTPGQFWPASFVSDNLPIWFWFT